MTTVSTGGKIRRSESDKSNRSGTKTEMKMFSTKIGLIGKLFGCGHGDLSRPFSNGKIGYRSCLKCGAIKQFNAETLKTHGGFYYPPPVVERETV